MRDRRSELAVLGRARRKSKTGAQKERKNNKKKHGKNRSSAKQEGKRQITKVFIVLELPPTVSTVHTYRFTSKNWRKRPVCVLHEAYTLMCFLRDFNSGHRTSKCACAKLCHTLVPKLAKVSVWLALMPALHSRSFLAWASLCNFSRVSTMPGL